MLHVLLHSGIGDVAAVVTRYFGGTLLGTGGLVKAYSSGVQLALQTLPVVEKVEIAQITVVLDYSAVTPLQRILPDYEAQILEQDFATDATFTIKLPAERVGAFTAHVIELTNGLALVEVSEP
jgi:putative IMPACT (imprinted ancient) family translation regulator